MNKCDKKIRYLFDKIFHMKFIYVSIACLITLSVNAENYFFSSGSGDDTRSPLQAQHAATPWKSVGKLNEYFSHLKPGDTVFFERGNIFYGSIQVSRSGAKNVPIVFAGYGKGNDPVISGFTDLSGWRSKGDGIWECPCPAPKKVNILTIGNIPEAMGRYPNAGGPNNGYLRILAHGKNSISGNDPADADWKGAEVIIRKNRFILDKSLITAIDGNTISYRGGSYYGPTDKYGYFIQNSMKTLDKKGEWYYDPATRMMNIYFGTEDPSSRAIRASTIDTLVSIKNQRFIAFRGLSFTGSNKDCFNLSGGGDISITDCHIRFSGFNAVTGLHSDNVTVGNLVIDYSGNNAIDLEGSHNLVGDNKISRTGAVPGMGGDEHSYIGINIKGESNTVQYNTVDTTGYVSIFFLGKDNLIKNNSIDYFSFIKDDGGGIYTWSGDIDSSTVRNGGTITGNIVRNGITAAGATDSSTAGIAIGIYLDENSSGISITDNTVTRCTYGIFLQDAHEVTVKNNNLFDNGAQLSIRHALPKGTLKNNFISENVAMSRSDDQNVLLVSSVDSNVRTFAEWKDNRYPQTRGKGSFFRAVIRRGKVQSQSKGTLDMWKDNYYGKDNDARRLPPVSPDNIRLEYNATKADKTVPLDRTYRDADGREYSGNVRLKPYASILLFRAE